MNQIRRSQLLIERGRRLLSFGNFSSRPPERTPREWKWRLVGIAIVALYFVQDMASFHCNWLRSLQSVDEYKYATGTCLLLFVGYQWYLFLARMRRKKLLRPLVFHQRTGTFAPILFYLHSTEFGYGYLAVLSWVFLINVVVGLANPTSLKIPFWSYSYSYRTVWILLHVTLAALTIIIALYHAHVAVYYK